MKAKEINKKLKMVFTESAFNHIKDTVGTRPVEQGGVLLGSREDFIVRKFIYDKNANTNKTEYNPDLNFLNKEVKENWVKNGLAFLGFVHSHPHGLSRLSGVINLKKGEGDIAYIKKIFKKMPKLNKFLAPIVYSGADREFNLFPYVVSRDDVESYELAQLKVLPFEKESITSENKEPVINDFTLDLSRLEGAVDVNVLNKARIVCVGVGGANKIVENFVRSGVTKIDVVDYDTVDNSNLSTQGFYIDDIGKLKVDVLGKRLKGINPALEYNGINANFLKMEKNDIKKLMQGADLLLMMTDDFHCQAKGNRVALKYNLPSVFAMMYEKAKCSEITFMIPGITPACHRCAVSSRYKAYKEGFKNDVTSTGSTIFHTHYLNSTIGMIGMAILNRNTSNFEFSNWFGHSWDRNLIQLRTHPSYSNSEEQLFGKTFNGNKRVFNFDSVWQKIEAESFPKYKEHCPDCGGIGDLNTSSKLISLLQNPDFRKTEWLKDSEDI